MICCDNILDLGCVGFCESIKLPFELDLGIYYIEVELFGVTLIKKLEVTDSSNILLELKDINENMCYTFKIKGVDGYIEIEIDGIKYNCFKLINKIKI